MGKFCRLNRQMTTLSTARSQRGQGSFIAGQGLLDRWSVLQLVKDSAKITGIREREIAILSAHLSVLPKGPVNPRHLLISYAQVTGMLERANCMDERRFRRGEAKLEELGFITRKLSGNGRRFPVRDGQGSIVDAYGIDLSPLFARLSELHDSLQHYREESAQKRAVQSRISARLSAIKRQAIAELGFLAESLSQQLAEFRNRLRRLNTSLRDLQQIEREVEDLTPGDPVGRTHQPEQRTSGLRSETPIMSADDRQTDRHIESPRKEYNKKEKTRSHVDPTTIWAQCTALTQYYPEPPKSVNALVAIIYQFFGFLGLRQDSKEKAVTTFGILNTIRIAEYMARRGHSISQPDRYIQHMIEEYLKGNKVAAGTVSQVRSGQL